MNHQSIRDELEEEGMLFQTAIDTEVILSLVAKYYKGDIVEAVKKTMARIKGAYSVVMLFEDKLIAFRDPNGFKMCIRDSH